jgi:hypothetical protein
MLTLRHARHSWEAVEVWSIRHLYVLHLICYESTKVEPSRFAKRYKDKFEI